MKNIEKIVEEIKNDWIGYTGQITDINEDFCDEDFYNDEIVSDNTDENGITWMVVYSETDEESFIDDHVNLGVRCLKGGKIEVVGVETV